MIEHPWLVVGVTVRALVQAAARHGHRVCAIDAFADREVIEACEGRVVRLETRIDWSLDEAQLGRALAEAGARFGAEGFCGVIAGSGFDSLPALRSRLARSAPLYGCAAATIRAVRDPRAWFALLDRVGAAHPAVRFEAPPAARGWLVKSASGSGGWHVQRWRRGGALAADGYFQRHARGRPASVLFAADGRSARVLGWQWQLLAPTRELPWRYGGIMTAPDMPTPVRTTVSELVARLVAAVPLRGLASLDFLVDGDRVQILELNPRPTASIALYPERDLFGLHIRASVGALYEDGRSLPAPASATVAPARGEAVLFAPAPVYVCDARAWPAWCNDLPAAATRFERGDPVCTVHASAPTVRGLRARLARRLHDIASTLDPVPDHDSPHDYQEPQRQRACATDRPGAHC